MGTETNSVPNPHVWRPNLTVAAVIERGRRFLLVEEVSDNPADGDPVFNQPAGHVESGEGIVAAVMREVLEETGWSFTPRAFVGSYYWTHPSKGLTYLRLCFAGDVDGHDPARTLDHGILRTHWLTRTEVEERGKRLRSPMVLACIRDYEAGQSFPLHLVREL